MILRECVITIKPTFNLIHLESCILLQVITPATGALCLVASSLGLTLPAVLVSCASKVVSGPQPIVELPLASLFRAAAAKAHQDWAGSCFPPPKYESCSRTPTIRRLSKHRRMEAATLGTGFAEHDNNLLPSSVLMNRVVEQRPRKHCFEHPGD